MVREGPQGSPRETTGDGYDVTTEAASIVCLPGGERC